jgi:hypothetical protein
MTESTAEPFELNELLNLKPTLEVNKNVSIADGELENIYMDNHKKVK